MRDFHDAKTMAKTLRAELERHDPTGLTHSRSLEIVARQFGFADWNTLAAKVNAEPARTGAALGSPVPILRIFSEAKAREFYLDYLGFQVAWEHRFEPGAPLYMQIERGRTVLHLSEHHGDGSPGAAVFVSLTGLDAFHRELQAKEYRHLNPGIEDVPWGARQMTLVDPFGNTLRFNEYDQAP